MWTNMEFVIALMFIGSCHLSCTSFVKLRRCHGVLHISNECTLELCIMMSRSMFLINLSLAEPMAAYEMKKNRLLYGLPTSRIASVNI